MGLSTKQVHGDHGLDWSQGLLEMESAPGTVDLPKPPSTTRRQQQQQQSSSEPLDCPRCGSSNTKFCYYNNYNKSQPRHFCKACKRHWTKGGTLRNVPVGGGRKNKRLKAAATTTSDRKKNVHHQDVLLADQQNQQNSHHFSLPPPHHLGDQKKNVSDILYRALIINSSSASSVQPDPINGFTNKTKSSSMLQLPCSQDQNLQFSFSSLSPFENIPSPIPTFHQSLSGYDDDYYGGNKLLDSTVESPTITTTTTAATTSSSIFCQPPWQLLGPTTTSSSTVMAESQNYCWNWNDIDTLVSSDLNIPWDDNNNSNTNTEMKP